MNNHKTIDNEITRRASEGSLSCQAAFEIADLLTISPAEIGDAADRLNIRLNKCQLGLFGYLPEKKIVKRVENISDELKTAIMNRQTDGRIACVSAWEIASELKISKLSVSNACETIGIRIKPCQLGAF